MGGPDAAQQALALMTNANVLGGDRPRNVNRALAHCIGVLFKDEGERSDPILNLTRVFFPLPFHS